MHRVAALLRRQVSLTVLTTALVATLACCASPTSSRSQAVERACIAEAKTLTLAAESYWANTMTYPDDEHDLVAVGLLLQTSDMYDLVKQGDDYQLIATGDACKGVDTNHLYDTIDTYDRIATNTTPSEVPAAPDDANTNDCEAQRLTLEIAVEAYFAQYGAAPASEAALVQAALLREVVPGYDLGVGTGANEVVPDPSVCP